MISLACQCRIKQGRHMLLPFSLSFLKHDSILSKERGEAGSPSLPRWKVHDGIASFPWTTPYYQCPFLVQHWIYISQNKFISLYVRMIFKFDFKHQLKSPTLVLPKLHFSLNRTVRHEVSGFFQTTTHQHIRENKVKCFTLDVTTNFKWGLRNISRAKNNNWTNKNTDKKCKKTAGS